MRMATADVNPEDTGPETKSIIIPGNKSYNHEAVRVLSGKILENIFPNICGFYLKVLLNFV